MVRMFVHGGGGPETPMPNSEPPEGMDWDMYCGPAPLRPFNRKIHPGGWRNFLDFANGTLGDWGVHWLDQVLWWSDEKGPKRVYCTGGRPIAGPAGPKRRPSRPPTRRIIRSRFTSSNSSPRSGSTGKFAANDGEKHKIGCYFYGSKGTFHIGWRDGWTFYPANAKEAAVHEKPQLQEPDGHNLKLLWADFLDAIAKERPPAADIERAHRSTCMSLLGMLSYKLGRSVRWDGAKEQVIDDAGANRLLRRKYRAPWEYPEA